MMQAIATITITVIAIASMATALTKPMSRVEAKSTTEANERMP